MSTKVKGAVFWLTGLPASGKSSLAKELAQALAQRELPHLWLDSDDLRPFITPHPCYSPEERNLLYRTMGQIALRAAQGGVLVVVSATAPLQAYRDEVREKMLRFIEIYLTCDPQILRQRDGKDLYRRAEAGEIKGLPGVDGPYEAPRFPELTFDSGKLSAKQLADRLIRWIDGHGLWGLPATVPTHL